MTATGQTWSGTQVRDDGTGPVLIAHKLQLVVTQGPDAGLECKLDAPRIVVGSSPSVDLVLTDRTVSRQHLEIVAEDRGYVLRDLGSTNGTFVGETRVMEALIAPGTRVQLGDSELLFEPKKKWVKIAESDADAFGPLVGRSAAMRAVFGILERIAGTRLSVVLQGETGTGKELAARALHAASERASGPFVVVDCGALSPTLAESELFGHERGAFTGAVKARPGAFELASGGSIFLDEIGELPLDLQPKLLRAIERREVKRLGASQPTDVDVRIVCATHRNLSEMVSEGRFREDLYYRVAEVVIDLPPLRDRSGDLPLLAERILSDEARQLGRSVTFEPSAAEVLSRRGWPGNVRELRNVLRRAAALSESGEITVRELGVGPSSPSTAATPDLIDTRLSLKDARERWNSALEKQYLDQLLKATGGDIERAATAASVHPKSFRRLLRQHGLGQKADS